MSSPYLVSVARICRNVPSTLEVRFRAPFDERHEFEPRPFGVSDVPEDAEVDVQLRLESFRGGVRAKGQISAPWHGVCRRCSGVIEGSLGVKVAERFVKNPAPDDLEAYPFDGETVDLADLVHEAVLLELPIAPLCRPDCQGLCPVCGIDRNEASCSCVLDLDPRWATLDALKSEDDFPR